MKAALGSLLPHRHVVRLDAEAKGKDEPLRRLGDFVRIHVVESVAGVERRGALRPLIIGEVAEHDAVVAHLQELPDVIRIGQLDKDVALLDVGTSPAAHRARGPLRDGVPRSARRAL